MSSNANQTGFKPGATTGAVRGKQYIKKNADRMYQKSFGDLPEGTIYRDPAGFKAGEAITLQKDRFDQLAREPAFEDGDTILEKWNSLQKKGFSIAETTKEIRKNLDTGDWTLPLDIIPEIFVVNPEMLPLADMIPRVTTQDDEVVPTPLTDHPDISHGLETTNDTEGSYSYSDPTYDDTVSFDVIGYGAATRLEDKLILASSNLRNAESSQEQAFMRAMRQEEERQLILGSNNDANGFTGLDSREETYRQIEQLTQAKFIHPSSNRDVICGQGTATKELIEEYPGLDAVIAPVGGGGLISGTSIATKGIDSNIRIYGAEPQMADDAYRSFKQGFLIPVDRPNTIADGLLTSLSPLTFKIINEYVDDILLAKEETIVEAMRLIWERMKLVAEPSAAVALAAIMDNRFVLKSKKVGVILSGGNVDFSNLPFK